jgi:hypothetical protein
MRSHFRLLLCLPILIAVSPTRAPAQRGALIEDLFRGVAEAQLEREKRKRLEREEEMRRAPAAKSGGIQPIPVPAPRTGRDRGPRSINTPSREVADMAQHLIDFSGVINPLVQELHEALHQREDLSRLQREAGPMLDGWQQLSKNLSDIERHGRSEGRAAGLRRAQQTIAPVVAQVAAALLER